MRLAIAIIITAASLVIFAFWIGKEITPPTNLLTVAPSPTTKLVSSKKITFNDSIYAYILWKESAPDLILVDNTKQQKNSEELMKDNNCRIGVNGGFYDTNDKPIGWMVINNEIISKSKNSFLFNGFVTYADNQFQISTTDPDTAEYGLQTGPILIFQNKAIKLSLANDKPARRMIIAKTSDGIAIMSVFDPEANLNGPYLQDLPDLIMKIGALESLDITDAVNLDGGSASAIYTETENLKELNYVGSWWCIK